MGEEAPAIGIDLGTTNSCVAVYQRGQVEIITNEHGYTTTPSCVVFNEMGRLIGEAAKEIIAVNPTSNAICDAKKLIGRRFGSSLQSDFSHMPIAITNHEGNPKIRVEYKGEAKTLFPEEVSAMVLLKMKESAEAYLGKTVTKAVITVPAHFNDSQRRATRNAGTIAGLNVLRIMNETSAAALAYAFKEKDGKQRNVLVFNLGEWSCDVSVVSISGGLCTVKSTRGDKRLGGEHFNSRMVNHFITKIKKKTLRNDLAGNKKALARLRASCDDAKKLLSSAMEAAIEIDSLLPAIDFKSSITRSKFEELNDDLFYYALELVQKTIRDAGMNPAQIQKIILVGGSTRIPKIQTLLQQFLIEKELHLTIHVEEVVAYGAAIQASILQGDKSDSLKDLLNLVDVAPLALGIGVGNGDIMSTMIERYSTIPVSKISMFWIDQRITEFPFAEGQRVKVHENKLLGKITVNGLRPSPKGLYKILVTFSVGADGILNVSAATEFTGPNSQVTVTYEDTGLSDDVIARLVEDANRYSLDDVLIREQLDLEKARDSAIAYCRDVQTRLEKGLKKCKQVINTLGGNQMTSKEEIEEKKQMIECVLNEIRPIQEQPVLDGQVAVALLPVKVEPVDESYENQAKAVKRKRTQ